MTDVETIAKSLTKAQRDCIAMIGDDVVLASNIGLEVGPSLYKSGIITIIYAAGYGFTNLTEIGQQVRAYIGSSHD